MVTNMDSKSLTSEQEVDSGVESTNSTDAVVYLKISVPELNAQKCLQFHQEDTVWMAKQQILSSVAKTLKDGFNYGLFCPPMQGKAGKFLDEERPLKDYPLPVPIGYLEFKFKRRIYKQIQMNPRKMKQIHTKTNLKQMMEAVKKNDVNKVTKLTNAGLDPNFNDLDTGETPLTLAAMKPHPVDMVLALVNGGAHLDFRNKKGLTPIHAAAQSGNEDALRVLLDLGASANYRDPHGLTPLYHAVCNNASARCVEVLLYDHAAIGIFDEYGWTELHQASKTGNVQHLEQLIYYGADMNCQNSSGNTPLHVCATNQQEDCARVLMFRGAKKEVLNYANQDAFGLAVISGNTQLAMMIKEFSPDDVVPYKDFPTYSDKRRSCIPASTFSTLQRCRSNPLLHQVFENLPLESTRRLADDDVFDLVKKNERRLDRRRTELAYVSEFLADGPTFMSNTPRSLSISSSGSGPGGEIDLSASQRTSSLPRPEREGPPGPRTVVLQEGENGFGFILRGAKAPDTGAVHLDFVPTVQLPALQYFEQVEQNSPADGAGIRPGDFLLEVNGFDVRAASHDFTVKLIKESDTLLSLTIMTLKQTPFSTLSRVNPKSQTAAEGNSRPTSRRNSHSSLRSAGLAELENLDRLLLEYENSDKSFGVAVDPYNIASGDESNDPSIKVASIRSVHGKRLAPAIPKLELWTGNGNTDQTGMWKAKSAYCLASSSGHDLKICEPELSVTRNERSAIGASHLSLNQNSAGTLSRGDRKDRSWLNDDLTERPPSTSKDRIHRSTSSAKRIPEPPTPPVKVLDGPVKVEAHLDPSSTNSYRIMHSFSLGMDGGSVVSRRTDEPGSKATTVAGVVAPPGGKDAGNNATLQNGCFKVPPPPPPPPPPPAPLMPPKPRMKSVTPVSTTERLGGKVRPPVPSRKSRLTISSGVQKLKLQPPTEKSTYVHSGSARPSDASVLRVSDGGLKAAAAPSTQDFLSIAEAARQKFLDRKTSDSQDELNRDTSLENDFSISTHDLSTRPSSNAFSSFGLDGGSSLDTKGLTFQEELKKSLNKRSHDTNRRQTVIGGVGGFLPKSAVRPSEPVAAAPHKCASDKSVGRPSVFDSRTTNLVKSSEISLVLPPSETKQRTETVSPNSLASFIIPPPPLFIAENLVDAKRTLIARSPDVSHWNPSGFDLASLAPPPPPGFEDFPVIQDVFHQQTNNCVENFRPRDLSVGHPVVNWTVDEVCAWLESIHVGEFASSFRRNGVDGARLALLGRNELISLGVSQVGQRMAIERAIKKAIMRNH